MGNIFKTSIINTMRFNVKYFGLKTIFNPRVLISKNVYIKELKGKVILNNYTKRILIGFGETGIKYKKDKTIWENNGTIIFNGYAFIGYGSKIVNKGELVFGNNFRINTSSNIICYKNITFGDDCLLSWDITMMDTDFHKIINNNKILNSDKGIVIGNHCWIGYNCNIKKGTIIPDNSVIASNSVITQPLVKNNAIYVNNSAIKEDITWQE